jgi:hexokinase
MKSVNHFLQEQKLRASDIDFQQLVDLFTNEMKNGLAGFESSLRMIPTYIEADNEFLYEVPVVAIDAGGTNFRAAEVVFSKKGELEISEMVNERMPGLDGAVSKDEFFRTLAGYIRHIAVRCDRIGFCFSYPTEILPDKDGILLQFCKEVNAPGVIGQMIGKNLKEALGMPEKKIVLLNDTVATLLAGKSASVSRTYDSFIGFILGTGTNTCYIESNRNILKKPELDPGKSQIINIESGNLGNPPRTALDIEFDKTTANPGNYAFEKMISGAYLGNLCLHILKRAALENIFTKETALQILELPNLSSEDASNLDSMYGSKLNPLGRCITSEEDEINCVTLIDNLIDRAAKLVAANLAAVVLKTDKGKSEELPILLTIEGTAFYRMHNLKERFQNYFSDYLSGERKRYFEFTEVPQSSLVGAALAALIE